MSIRRIALAALLGSLPIAAQAELSINGNGSTWYFQSEPGTTWARHRQGVPTSHLLNPLGDARNDSAPSVEVNPASGIVEVAWSRGGSRPAVAFASWHAEGERWKVLEMPVEGGAPPRVTQLVHDSHGNRYIIHDDPIRSRVLLSSSQWDGHALNRSLQINPRSIKGASPFMLWDGERLVIAYARIDRRGIEIFELEPTLDDEGRIPNGGEGVPGIPEPVFQYSGASPLPAAMSVVIFPPLADPAAGPEEPAVPPLVRIEALSDGRILVTWVEEGRLGFVIRTEGAWGVERFLALADPVDHEQARNAARQLAQSRGRSSR